MANLQDTITGANLQNAATASDLQGTVAGTALQTPATTVTKTPTATPAAPRPPVVITPKEAIDAVAKQTLAINQKAQEAANQAQLVAKNNADAQAAAQGGLTNEQMAAKLKAMQDQVNAQAKPATATPAVIDTSTGATGTYATAQAKAQADLTAATQAANDRAQQAYDTNKTQIDQVLNGTFPLSAADAQQLKNIQSRFQSLVDQQTVANQNYEGAVRQAGISAGRSQFAPEIEWGNVHAAVSSGLSKVADIEIQMSSALLTAKMAIQDGNVKLLDSAYKKLTDLEATKRQAIKDGYDASMDAMKATEADLEQKNADREYQLKVETERNKPALEADARVQASILALVSKFPDAGIVGPSVVRNADGTYTTYAGDSLAQASTKVMASASYAAELALTRANAAKASTAAVTDQKIVKVNGTDYVATVNADGSVTYSTPQIPEERAQASEMKKSALATAQDLLAKFDEEAKAKGDVSAVGGSRVLPWNSFLTVPGSAASNFTNTFNSLRSQVSLDNVKLLKGQGAVSDAERRLLAEASTKLNLSQSEPEFRTTLQGIVDALSGPGEAPETTEKSGGSVSWRMNNPTNIKYKVGDTIDQISVSHGAVEGLPAKDGGTFALFPTVNDAISATKDKLKSPTFASLSLDAALKKWSGGGYGSEIVPTDMRGKTTGQMTDGDLDRLVSAMTTREGWTEGTASTLKTYNTSDEINANAKIGETYLTSDGRKFKRISETEAEPVQ